MVFCPQCGAANLEEAHFCDQCGAELCPVRQQGSAGEFPPSSVPPPPPPAAGRIPAGPLRCPLCKIPVILGQALCDNCGADLNVLYAPALSSGGLAHPAMWSDLPPPPQPIYPPPQLVGEERALPSPAIPSHGPNAAVPAAPSYEPMGGLDSLAMVSLILRDYFIRLTFPRVSTAIVGRTDPMSHFVPEIDLTPYDGLKCGVGRRHVRFWLQNQQVMVEDLNSTNGTFLNGCRLAPHVLYPAADGDTLMLGRMSMTIRIGKM